MAGVTRQPRSRKPYDQVLSSPLESLRAGGIGFVGADIPIELLLASGRPFGHLPWMAGAATPCADQWLESSFPGWARSVLEQWFAGAFDDLECVVFSRADDAAQRLCYYVRALQSRGLLRGPATHLLDLALIDRPSSLAHCAAAIEQLAGRLDIGAGAWPQAIARANDLRVTFSTLNGQRGSHGMDYARLFRAALWSDATRWILGFRMPTMRIGQRILLAGSMPPDERLHRAAEYGGACIVDELHAGSALRIGPISHEQEERPALGLARHLQRFATGPRAFIDRAARIVERVRASEAAAVVLWLTKEDEALAWHVPAQTRALRSAGIPVLALTASDWATDIAGLARVTDFCRSLQA